jgi:hypothetical protein
MAAVRMVMAESERRRPGLLARAQTGAIVSGIYDGDVRFPENPVLLAGACAQVNGYLAASRVHRVGGCPINTRALSVRLPWMFGMSTPLADLRWLAWRACKGLYRAVLGLGGLF